MSNCKIRRSELAQEFKQCKDAFIALGDETRQQIVIALLESDSHGIRVGEITKKNTSFKTCCITSLKNIKK